VLRAGQALSPRKKDRGIRGNGDRVALDSAVEEGGKVRECEAVRGVPGVSLQLFPSNPACLKERVGGDPSRNVFLMLFLVLPKSSKSFVF